MAETIVLDPTSEDSGNSQLTLTDTASGIEVISQKYGLADRSRITSSGPDTDYERVVKSGRKNRVIELEVRCFGTNMLAQVKLLQRKIGKLSQYRGTLKRTLGSGEVIVFDVLDADVVVPADHLFANFRSATCSVTLLCKPLGRGPEVQVATFSETSLPAAVFSFAAPAGDVPALGRLEVTEAGSADQAFLHWGVECAGYLGTAAVSSLQFAGTSRLAYNGSTALAVSGAVSGTVLNQGTLTTAYAAIMGLASSGTVYPSHIGTYDVWARVYMGTANAGTVSAALEWAQGDLQNYTRNDALTLPPSRKGAFLWQNFGQVALEKVTTGAQRWDGRIIAKSTTTGDDLAVDYVDLFPVLEGYGEARAVQTNPAVTAFTAWDDFTLGTYAGGLIGDTLPRGGTWGTVASAYETDDFTVGAGVAARTVTNDSAGGYINGRWLYATGTSGMTAQAVRVTGSTGSFAAFAAVARAVDRDNFAFAFCAPDIATNQMVIGGGKYVGGTLSVLAGGVGGTRSGWPIGTAARVFFMVSASGRWQAGLEGADGSRRVLEQGQDSVLATGGALASGYAGFLDYNATGSAQTRHYYDFQAWVPTFDAVVFAGKKATVYHDRFRRQDTAGTAVGKAGDYRGDYLRIPASNVGGTVRMIARYTRGLPESGADSAVDDIGGTVWATPLYLNVPEP